MREMKKEALPELTDVQEKILFLIKHYGTSTQGEEFRLHQVAIAIDELFFELDEGSQLIRDLKFIKVVPA